MLPVARWPNPKDSIAFAMLTRNGVLLARNRLIRPLFKEMNWAKPEIRVRRDQGYAIFESASLVWGVCLDLDGDQPLEDNFFDLYPGVPYRIAWPHAELPHILFTGNLHQEANADTVLK